MKSVAMVAMVKGSPVGLVSLISPSGTRAVADSSIAGRVARLGWKVEGKVKAESASSPEVGAVVGPDAPTSAAMRPNKNATRGAWAVYAESVGVAPGDHTRAELIELIEGK